MKLVDALTVYVNDQLGIMDPEELLSASGRSMSSQGQGMVLREMWSDLSIIDDFVRANPMRLGKRDLDQVRQWRNGIAGYFTMGELPREGVVLVHGGHVFRVRGISREISTMCNAYPCVLRTMVVPFDGVVTYMTVFEFIDVDMGAGMLDSLDEEVQEAFESGRIVERDFEHGRPFMFRIGLRA